MAQSDARHIRRPVKVWILSPIEQNWDHRNAALQRRAGFNAHNIARIIDTTIALFIGDVEPSGPITASRTS